MVFDMLDPVGSFIVTLPNCGSILVLEFGSGLQHVQHNSVISSYIKA